LIFRRCHHQKMSSILLRCVHFVFCWLMVDVCRHEATTSTASVEQCQKKCRTKDEPST
jgi:hypothetical protein